MCGEYALKFYHIMMQGEYSLKCMSGVFLLYTHAVLVLCKRLYIGHGKVKFFLFSWRWEVSGPTAIEEMVLKCKIC